MTAVILLSNELEKNYLTELESSHKIENKPLYVVKESYKAAFSSNH